MCYVLGIGITYALLGVMAAKTGSFFGALLASPIVISAIAIVFVLMGLSMYGVFEVQTPLWIQSQLSEKKIKKGFKGVFFAGLISGIVASPCVGTCTYRDIDLCEPNSKYRFRFSTALYIRYGTWCSLYFVRNI